MGVQVGHSESIRPLGRLSPDWVKYACDNSPEFRLARAMASILAKRKDRGRVGTIRENLEPLEGASWKEGSVSCVWTVGAPLSNMLSVLQRRCLEGRMNGLNYPPLDSAYSARLNDIVSFLNGDVDDQRVVDLVLPLSFVQYEKGGYSSQDTPVALPQAYAAMKLTLLPGKFACKEFGEDREIRMELRMLSMLRAGRVKDAYEVAHRRLMASGLRPISDSPGIPDGSDYGRGLAAALLFPLDKGAHYALARRALRKPRA